MDATNMPALKIPAFVINLADDQKRRQDMVDQFAALPAFDLQFVQACDGRQLPQNVRAALSRDARWAELKGTIGCFLSHAKAWEAVAGADSPWSVVLEDDVRVAGLRVLLSITLPLDAGILFLNDRMSPNLPDAAVEPMPIWHALRRLDALRSGPGGDGYLLTREAAASLLSACVNDLYYGHVDGRLLRYATSEDDLAKLNPDSWIASVVRHHHHPALMPKLGLVRGYCLPQPLVIHRGIPSSREAGDQGTIFAQPLDKARPSQAADSMLPIRFWNRVDNIGDLINPHIIETVSGQRSFFTADETAEHVLGIGSVFFMATRASHIWGSGIMEPERELGDVDPDKVHAVRGRLTLEILRARIGLRHPVEFGDPGIFVDEIPEVAVFRRTTPIRRRVALVPHYTMVEHGALRQLAAALDADFLSPRTGRLDFLREIIASEIVVSQSLHGLIFAEALGKPSVWLSHTGTTSWNFKFHDWFTNTEAPPDAPVTLGTPARDILAAARLTGIKLDRQALRQAMPRIESTGREPGLGFRECRMSPTFVLHVTDCLTGGPNWDYDETAVCPRGDERTLREILNSLNRRWDEPRNVFLVFNPAVLAGLSTRQKRACHDLLTLLPKTHFVGIPRLEEPAVDPKYLASYGDSDELTVDAWNDVYSWTGIVLLRHATNFSFQAPGLAAFPLRRSNLAKGIRGETPEFV